jgi:hypothetical protein
MSPSDQIKAVYDKYSDLPDVTWVGPNFRTNGLVLGFDNGSIIFTVAATGHVSDPEQLSPSGEAINGIAANGAGGLAVSTRSEVSFFQANSSVEPTRVDFFPGGAHGVIATKSGSYVAPLGPNGLLIVRPTNDFLQKEVTKGTEGKLHFNRAASLHDQLGTETLIFANRKNGVGLCVFSSDERPRVVHTMGFEGIDVVDVCAVSTGSLSAIAVSKTADLLWINDTSQNTDPVVIRPTHVEGAVYRALATSRHLFVLTSKALYVWFDFVNRAIAGQFASTEMVRLVLPIDAIDMYLLDDQYLFLVMGVNAVTSLAITDIEGQLDGKCATEFRSGISSGSFEKTALDDIDQAWQTADVKQQNLVLA